MQLKQDLQASQKLAMTLSLRTAIDLLGKNTDELIDFINKEAEENIFLDFIDKDAEWNRQGAENPDWQVDQVIEEKVEADKSLEDFLMEQLRETDVPEEVAQAGQLIIYSLDDKGFFTEELDDFAQDFGLDLDILSEALTLVQSFEPAGIAAKDAKACLLAQTRDPLLRKLIDGYLYELAMGELATIRLELGLSESELAQLIYNLKTLSPYPSVDIGDSKVLYLYPEFLVEKRGDFLELDFKYDLTVHVNDAYKASLKSLNGPDKQLIQEMYYRANYIQKAVRTRQVNLHKVGHALVEYQADFFLKDAHLKPLTMTELADQCQISQSTVSRICANKYLSFQGRLYPLRKFFPRAIATVDGAISPLKTKEMILELIKLEDPEAPFSDEKLSQILNRQGISIKRRTISKYRRELGLASSYQRLGGVNTKVTPVKKI